jgi:hypothetical protein
MSRPFHRRISILALMVWVAGAVGPTIFPHTGGFDLACPDEAWASPHPTTQIENVRPPVADDHCMVCHLQRMGGGAYAERVGVVWLPESESSGVSLLDDRPISDRALRIPARAPPSLL